MRDTIADFSSADRDRIDLSGIDANTSAAGNQAFHFLVARGFDGSSGALRYGVTADGVTTIGDINGDRRVDFAIDVADVDVLHPRDLIL
ncbi:M10 family metallopeptidase C-terminal domain-containing protein [Amaricoccus sp.]|uniref:M10 family metallopeptidase C-terminal domain-containing protein n=1 Tax=Amaricoccus sp. TaxID=1872485 RepID=UPI0039E427D8